MTQREQDIKETQEMIDYLRIYWKEIKACYNLAIKEGNKWRANNLKKDLNQIERDGKSAVRSLNELLNN